MPSSQPAVPPVADRAAPMCRNTAAPSPPPVRRFDLPSAATSHGRKLHQFECLLPQLRPDPHLPELPSPCSRAPLCPVAALPRANRVPPTLPPVAMASARLHAAFFSRAVFLPARLPPDFHGCKLSAGTPPPSSMVAIFRPSSFSSSGCRSASAHGCNRPTTIPCTRFRRLILPTKPPPHSEYCILLDKDAMEAALLEPTTMEAAASAHAFHGCKFPAPVTPPCRPPEHCMVAMLRRAAPPFAASYA